MTDVLNVGGIKAELEIGNEGFRKGMTEAKDDLNKVADQAKKFNNDFRSVSKVLRDAGMDAREIRKIKTELLNTRPDIVEKQLSAVEKQLRSIGASSEDVAKVKARMQEVQQSTGAAGAEIASLSSKVERVDGKPLNNVNNQLKDVEQNGRRAGERINAIGGILATLGASRALSGLVNTITTLTQEAQNLSSAYKGLDEVAKSVGQNQEEVGKAVNDLVAKGFMDAAEAATAYKTALSSGYTLEESTNLINALGDAAAYNREAHLGWGEAVVSALRGIKQQQSNLTDSAGITTNLSVMYERYAATIGKSAAKLTDAEKLQAAYNGMMQEAALFAGNAESAMDGFAGTQSYFNQTITTARQELGEAFLPIVEELLQKLGPMIVDFTRWVEANKEVAVGLAAGAAAVLGLITVLGSLVVVIGAVTAAFTAMNIAMGPVGWLIVTIGLAAAGVTAYGVVSSCSF